MSTEDRKGNLMGTLMIILIILGIVIVMGVIVENNKRIGDNLYESPGGEFSLEYDDKWNLHSVEDSLLFFTKEENLPDDVIELSSALSMSVNLGSLDDFGIGFSVDDWLAINSFVETDLVDVLETATLSVNELQLSKYVRRINEDDNVTVNYVYFFKNRNVLTFTIYPWANYPTHNREVADLEEIVKSIKILKDEEAQSVVVVSGFDDKIVYGTDQELEKRSLYMDCRERGGVFNTCGSPCENDDDICITVCALTCELNEDAESFVDERACKDIGGKWEVVDFGADDGAASCNLPTLDEGKICSDSSECESYCENTNAEIGEVTNGQCYGFQHATCMREVINSLAQPEWCI